jgi:hypothetical protein
MEALIVSLQTDYEKQYLEENLDWVWLKHTFRNSGAYKAANIFEEYDIETEVIDFLPYWKDEEIIEFLETRKHKNYKFIGFSTTFPTWATVQKFVNLLKEYFPDAIYIAGGQQKFVEDVGCDYYIAGFAEKALPAVIEHVLHNSGLDATPLFGGKLLETLHGKYQTHLIGEYRTRYREHDYISPLDTPILEIGRGCKFKCDFCSFSLIGLRDRTIRTSESIREELIENYERFGIKNYMIADDTLNETNERIQVLADAIDGLDFKPSFSAFVRVDIVNAHPEQIDLLIKARVIGQYYGIETLSKETGKSIGKGLSPEKTKETLLKLHKKMKEGLGEFHADIGMIIGLPYESEEQLRESFEWLKENWHDEGQHVGWWPFEITGDGILSSKIYNNPEKYGYKVTAVEGDEQKDLLNQMVFRPTINSLLWKNEHLSAYDAYNLFREFVEYWHDGQRSNGYSEALTSLTRCGSVNAGRTIPDYNQKFKDITYSMLDEYKQKKLNRYK